MKTVHASIRVLLCVAVGFVPLRGCVAQSQSVPPNSARRSASAPRDGSHDFDFEIGRWKVHNSVLRHGANGAPSWIEYDGISVARRVWGGRAVLLELESETPAGHREGLVLRLYNPVAHQWSTSFASSQDGALNPPSVGEFRNGRAEFFGQDQVDGRSVLTRSVLSNITVSSYKLEQAVSRDGGKSWEVMIVSDHTRTD